MTEDLDQYKISETEETYSKYGLKNEKDWRETVTAHRLTIGLSNGMYLTHDFETIEEAIELRDSMDLLNVPPGEMVSIGETPDCDIRLRSDDVTFVMVSNEPVCKPQVKFRWGMSGRWCP